MIELAVGAGVTVSVGVMLLVIALRLADAERRCGDARVNDEGKAKLLAIALADVATWQAKATAERTRADALDTLLDEFAGAGDAAGARARVLRAWANRASNNPDPAGGASTPAVPVPSAPDPARADELERP